MSDLLKLVEGIALEAHAGQLYGDRDYVKAHVAPIVGIIAQLGYGVEYQAAGWLHDVPEDSSITPQELLKRGVPQNIVNAVILLTKNGSPHDEYLYAIAGDPLATVTKFVDSSVNFANTILQTDAVHPDKFVQRATTYAHNIAFLEPRLPLPDMV